MQTNAQLVIDSNGRVDASKISGTAQTARDIGGTIGAAGAGLTALGDTRLANLDATVSSRSTLTAANVWDYLTSAATTVGSIGKRIADFLTGDAYVRIGAAGAGLTALGDTRIANLDAAVSSRSTYAGGAVASVTGNVGGNVVGSVGSVTGGVTVSTNNDKTGYALPTAGILAIWHQLTSAIVTAGTIGKLILDNLDAAISSRSTYAGGDTAGTTTLLGRLTSTRATNLDNLDAAVSTRSTFAGGAVASVTGAVGSVTAGVTVTTNNDKTGYALSTAGVLAIWHQLTSAIVTAGTTGKLIIDYLDAAISSRSTYAGADTAGTTTLLSRLTAVRAGYLDTLNGIVAAIWAAVTDSTGVTTLLARLTAPRAANLDNADVATSTRLAATAYASPDNAGISAIKAKTDQLTFTKTHEIDANVQSVNDAAVTGTGSEGDEWGPA